MNGEPENDGWETVHDTLIAQQERVQHESLVEEAKRDLKLLKGAHEVIPPTESSLALEEFLKAQLKKHEVASAYRRETCRCPCHENDNVMHIVPCC